MVVPILILEPVIEHEHTVGLIVPLADQARARLQPQLAFEVEIAPVAHLLCEAGKLTHPRRWKAAMIALLYAPSDCARHKIGAQTLWQRTPPMDTPPLGSKLGWRHRRQLSQQILRNHDQRSMR